MATLEPEKPTLHLPWPFQLAPRAEKCAFTQPQILSLSSWSAARKEDCSDSKNNSRDSICWSSMNWDMSPSLRLEPNCFRRHKPAYEHHSLMVSTNLAFEEWTEIFGSERLTGALLDRLTHRCHILEANGESYRLRQAKKRSKQNIITAKLKPGITQELKGQMA